VPRPRIDSPAENAARHDRVGQRLKSARHELGLSTRALAAEAGVSQSLISQIERGECEPSLSTLRSISAALGLMPHDLIGQQASGQIEVSRRSDKQIAFSDSPENVTGRRLVNQPNALLEAYQLTIAGAGEDNWFTHPGDELVLVNAGSLEVHFEGRETVVLGEGDSLYHSGDVPHMWRHIGRVPTTVTHVVSSGSHHGLSETTAH
jgi:transcriptional regulator with XRE-family HTH domain